MKKISKYWKKVVTSFISDLQSGGNNCISVSGQGVSPASLVLCFYFDIDENCGQILFCSITKCTFTYHLLVCFKIFQECINLKLNQDVAVLLNAYFSPQNKIVCV